MYPTSPREGINLSLYVETFNEQAKKIQEATLGRSYALIHPEKVGEGKVKIFFKEITDLYNRTINTLLNYSSLENIDANQLLESITALHHSYETIQNSVEKLDQIAEAGSDVAEQREKLKIEAEAFIISTKFIIEKINTDNFKNTSTLVSEIIELCEMTGKKLRDAGEDTKKIKELRALATEKIKEILERCIYSNRENLEENPSEFNQALEYFQEICTQLIKAGWKLEGRWLQGFIGDEFKAIKVRLELGKFNDLSTSISMKILELIRKPQEVDLVNQMREVLETFVLNQKEKIIQHPEALKNLLSLYQEAIDALQKINKNTEAILLRSQLGNILGKIAKEHISDKKKQVAEDPTITLQVLKFCDLVVNILSEMKETEAALHLQSQVANTMKEIAEKYNSDQQEQVLKDSKIGIRLCQLCNIAAARLDTIGLTKEALSIRDLTKNISFKEQEAFETFINNNREKIEQDPAVALQAQELCDKTVQFFLEIDLTDRAITVVALAAKVIPIPNSQSHPLYDLSVVFKQLRNRRLNPELGSRVSALDTGILKGGSISVKERNIENKMTACIDFTINPVRREIVGKHLEGVQANIEKFNQSIPLGLCQGVKIHEKKEYVFKFADENKMFSEEKGFNLSANVMEIEFEGLGKVVIVKDPEVLSLYNTISIELEQYLDPQETLRKLNQMVVLLGLGPIFQLQRQEDDERMKIGQLFKAYYPAKSYEMERTSAFYELPIEKLCEKMISEEKGMEKVFKKYLYEQPQLMVKEEIYTGEAIWTVGDLSTQLKEKGALGCVSKLTGDWNRKDEAENKLISIIEMGILSSMERFFGNVNTVGMSSTTDIRCGSGREVFSRLLTKNNINDYDITDGCYILFDLDIVNRVTYLFERDLYGSKVDWEYRERESLINLLEHNPDFSIDNEHMSKKRVQPDKLRLVLDKSLKEVLIIALHKRNLIEEHDDKKYIKVGEKLVLVDDMILEKPQKLTLEMFS